MLFDPKCCDVISECCTMKLCNGYSYSFMKCYSDMPKLCKWHMGDFINSCCTDVQEGERSWQKSQDFQTQTLNQTHQFHLLNQRFAISLYYLLFWNYQHSQENLATTEKLLRNTSTHTFALRTPLKRASPTNLTQRCKEFFVLFCFVLAMRRWPLMMAFLLKP